MEKLPYYARHFQIKEGDVIVNLGACIGKATLFFSQKVGDKGLVVAVEPVVENYRRLVQTIITNKLSNVIPLLTAISGITAYATINLADSIKYYASHSLIFEQKCGNRVVPTISWDDLVEACNLSHVDLLKMNIEGGEVQVLRGMHKVLPHGIIISEHLRFEKDPDQILKEIYHSLQQEGYMVVKRERCYIYARKNDNQLDQQPK